MSYIFPINRVGSKFHSTTSFFKGIRQVFIVSLLCLSLSACFDPPYNNFRINKNPPNAHGASQKFDYLTPRQEKINQIIKRLEQQHIVFHQHGNTMNLIVPTDEYYEFDSPKLNDLNYRGLNNIVRLLKYYPCTPFYVAGFTDDVGSRPDRQKLSQALAETMVTFLWAHDIKAHRFHPEGYRDKHSIGDNKWIRGSAYNRRVEIQWIVRQDPCKVRKVVPTK